jgi:hypothetical protein
MTVSYNSKYIIPAPYLNLQKTYVRSEDAGKINPSYKMILTGKLVPQKGSPSSSGTFWTSTGYPSDETGIDYFDSLINKQEALRHLFADDGKIFEVKSCTGTNILCRPTVDDIQFSEGNWYSYIDYSINMTATRISGALANEDDLKSNDFPQHLSSVKESWNLEETDEYLGIELGSVYNLSHNINAVGYNTYNDGGIESRGWQQSREWVYPRLGLDTTILTGTSGIGLPAYYSGYNYKRTEETDELGGSYSVNETWTISSGNTIEDFNINVRIPTDSYIVSITADGSIRGLGNSGVFSPISNTKWDNALTKYNLLAGTSDINTIYDRTQTYSGYNNINPAPVSKTIAKNPVNGTINYTWEYDTRPTTYVSGAIYENISISNTYPAQVFGSIPVPGRSVGPVLQDMGTTTAAQKTLNIDVIMPYYSGISLITSAGFTALYNSFPTGQVDVIVNSFNSYLTGVYDQVFMDNTNDSYDIKTGRYNRTVSWTLGDCS